MAFIETIDLEKTYVTGFWRHKERAALRRLTLAIQQGEVLGFLGPNGAGKTTTLKLLTGLIFPTGGSATIMGMRVDDPRVRAHIGYSPEQPYFYDYLTAEELLRYYADLSAVPAKGRAGRIEAALQRAGLPESRKLQLRKFSKGMLQRLSIAQAILHDPEVVFLDEPMSGLDPAGRHEVRQLIQELKDTGKTIFFSTHILSDAETLCDRVAVLNKGELRGIGVMAELKSRSSENTEIQWSGHPDALRLFSSKARATGELNRAEVSRETVDVAIDAIRKAGGNILAITPIRSTLEDYFLDQLKTSASDEVRQ